MIRVNLLTVGIPTIPQFTNPGTLPEVHSSTSFRVVRGRVRKSSEGVLAHLADNELRALDPWERDDLRVSWLTVLYCSEIKNYSYLADNAQLIGKRVGESLWEYAFWMYFGKTFDRAQKAWSENRAENEILLTKTALPPKKPSGSVPLPTERKRVA